MTAVLVHFPEPQRRPIGTVEPITRILAEGLDRPVVLTDFRPLDVARFVEAQVLREHGAAALASDALSLLTLPPDDPRRVALLDDVFGDDDRDRRLRCALDLAHASPPVGEREALTRLHVSRRTWFRLLREARERVAAHPDRGEERRRPLPG